MNQIIVKGESNENRIDTEYLLEFSNDRDRASGSDEHSRVGEDARQRIACG